jgi:TetR/AcrR family transcriptional repressor of nem operon
MTDKTTREYIVESADRLFYQRGFEHTSFSDIAESVQISRGNFYHHFKSKDEILDAVISARRANTLKILERWELESNEPKERIRSFIHILIANGDKIRMHGCPVGTLCSELAKLEHASQSEANELFELFREWLRRQFTLLGRKSDADELALHLLARSQGVAVLANAIRGDAFVRREVRQLDDWLASCTSRDKRGAGRVSRSRR